MDFGTSEPWKSCWRLQNNHIFIKSHFLALQTIFVDLGWIWVPFGYLFGRKTLQNAMFVNCIKNDSSFSWFLVIPGQFWMPFGDPWGGVPRGTRHPFSHQGAPRSPRGVPRSIFHRFVNDFYPVYRFLPMFQQFLDGFWVQGWKEKLLIFLCKFFCTWSFLQEIGFYQILWRWSRHHVLAEKAWGGISSMDAGGAECAKVQEVQEMQEVQEV